MSLLFELISKVDYSYLNKTERILYTSGIIKIINLVGWSQGACMDAAFAWVDAKMHAIEEDDMWLLEYLNIMEEDIVKSFKIQDELASEFSVLLDMPIKNWARVGVVKKLKAAGLPIPNWISEQEGYEGAQGVVLVGGLVIAGAVAVIFSIIVLQKIVTQLINARSYDAYTTAVIDVVKAGGNAKDVKEPIPETDVIDIPIISDVGKAIAETGKGLGKALPIFAVVAGVGLVAYLGYQFVKK